jgi:hypothetical protein
MSPNQAWNSDFGKNNDRESTFNEQKVCIFLFYEKRAGEN